MLQTASTSTQTQYRNVISGANTAVGSDQVDNTAVVLVTLPGAPQGATSSTIQLLHDNLVFAEFSIDIVPDFTTRASVGRAIVVGTTAAQSGLGGGVALELLLTGFSIVRSVDSIIVEFNGEEVSVSEFISSSATGTLFRVLVPAVENPGRVDVVVYPSFSVMNNATVVFTYIDDRSPQVLNINPGTVYADGGSAVTVELVRFSSITDPANVQVTTVDSEGTSSTVVASSITHGSQRSSIVFAAPAGAAGTVIVSVQGGTLAAASSTMVYAAVPTAPGTMTVRPNSGSMFGSTAEEPRLVTIAVLGMRMAASKAEIGLTVGGVSIDLASDPDSRLVSTMAQTSITFNLPASSAPGTVAMEVWSTVQPQLIASASFRYFDSRQPAADYFVPRRSFAGEAINVTVGLLYFDISSGVLVDVSAGGVSARFHSFQADPGTNATSGSAQVEIQSSTTSFGAIEITLLPCSARSDPLCSRNVSFVYTLLDPTVVQFVDIFPRQGLTFGETPVTIRFQNLAAGVMAGTVEMDLGFANITATEISYDASASA
eukprot:2195504-Rhodomonas_salina.1